MSEAAKTNFRALFFRHYDRKISDGTVTFSQLGIKKDDFTKLCTEPDFVLDRESIERACNAMKLTKEETYQIIEAADAVRKE